MTTSLHDLMAADPAAHLDVDDPRLVAATADLRDAVPLHGDAATAPDGVAAAAPSRRARRSLQWRRRGIAALAVAGVALAVTAVAGPTLSGGGSDGPLVPFVPESAYAAKAVRVAKVVPRLLPSTPGWRVVGADQFDETYGQLELSRGNRWIELTWYPIAQWDQYWTDRQLGSDRFADAKVAGSTAHLLRYTGSDVYIAMWKAGAYFVQARTEQDMPADYRDGTKATSDTDGPDAPHFVTHYDEASFRAFVTSLRIVPATTWLDAMPAAVVRPDAAAATVAAMLKGVPLPADFDPSTLTKGSGVRGREQLAARVTEAVSCAWYEDWSAAKAAGDAPRQRKAVAAMATAASWPTTTEDDLSTRDALAFAQQKIPNGVRPATMSADTYYRQQFCQR